MGYKVNKIRVGTQQVRPSGWKPDASRTLLYLPLESNANDYSGNNRTCTPTSVTYTTVGGVQSAHVGTTGGISVGPTGFVNKNIPYCTISVLLYTTVSTSTSNRLFMEFAIQNTNYMIGGMFRSGHGTRPNQYVVQELGGGTIVANQWKHICYTSDGTTKKIYIDGVLKNTASDGGDAWGSRPYNYENSQTLFNSRGGVSGSAGLNGNAREIIFENILWSAEDVSKYYQRIKAKLGF